MTDKKSEAIVYVIDRLLAGELNLKKLKSEAGIKFKLNHILKTNDIAAAFPKNKLTPEIGTVFRRKPVRTVSGVTPIAVMIKPEGSCPYGCIYCPFTGKAAKSYTGSEPAALRARSAAFDPAKQVEIRLKQYEISKHPADKCEIILMGGTFLNMDAKYKQDFVKGIYDTLNGKKSPNLDKAIKNNENAKHRAVGLTIETRPDVCNKEQIKEILGYGATRVELGVQNPNDAIYRRINRGHSVSDVVRATADLKDSAFKVCYHIMPGLPGSNPTKDIVMVNKLFGEERFKPDMLKIYPTLVMPGTGLHKLMLDGRYKPYNTETAADTISEFYRSIPKYVRVMRIQRDIPVNLIAGGVDKSNLRELVERRIEEKGIHPQEIRYREIGFAKNKNTKGFTLQRLDYRASGGTEVFLSFEDKNSETLAGFIRLRIPNAPFMKELDDSALVREFHVYGEEASLAETTASKAQHKGFGTRLLAEAEEITKKEFGLSNLTVISGVGVREYFYNKGYRLNGPYVSKRL
jgi:elongator complex protein 3